MGMLSSTRMGVWCKTPAEEELDREAWKILKGQTKKGTFFIDCANLAALELYKLDKIASFDTFYPKLLRFSPK